MTQREDVVSILSEKGIKITPQRVAVLEFLEGNPNHPSIDEIYQEVKKRFPHISRATIYNTIETMVEAGILKEILLQQEKTHVDWNVAPHHHFKCQKCGMVEDISYDILTPRQATPPMEGYKVNTVQLTMEGVCAKCH